MVESKVNEQFSVKEQNKNGDVNEKKGILYDDLLLDLGKFGYYQKYQYLLICLPAICSAFSTMMLIFTLGEHNHRCAVPGIRNDTYAPYGGERTVITNDSLGNTVVEVYSQCKISINNTAENVTTIQNCDAWVYDKSIYQTTIISDLNLVCDRVLLQSHAGMVYFGGRLFGNLTFMPWADIRGRKPVLCLALFLVFVFNLATVWIPNFLTYAIFRFINGIMDSAYWGAATIIGLELVHPSKRELAGVSINYFWCLGEFILCGLAYWLRNWRDLQLAAAVPMGLFIGYYFMIEESPRWLLSKGRNDTAHVILRKIAKHNKVELSEEIITIVRDPIDPNEEVSLKSACIPIMKSPRLMFWIAIAYFNIFVINLGYLGISFNVATLGNSVYLDFLVSSMMEVIASVVCSLSLKRIGRRLFLCCAMLLGGLACLCTIFTSTVDKNAPIWIAITLSMIGKLGVTAAMSVIYIIASEISPTPVRSFVVGIGDIFGQTGSMVAPYVAEINNLIETDFGKALSFIIYGALMFTGGITALLLPETNNTKLPDTVEQAEQLKKNISKQNESDSSHHIQKSSSE